MASTGNAVARVDGQASVIRLPAPRVRLTARSVLSLPGPDQGRERVYRDQQQPGLALVVDHAGRRSYIVTGRSTAGRGFRLKIADATAIDLGDARKAARIIAGKAAMGIDPGHERRAERAALRAARAPSPSEAPAMGPTLAEAAAAFLRARERDLRLVSWLAYKSTLERFALPALGDKEISEITRNDINALLAQITTTAGPVAANRLRSVLSALFIRAERDGQIAASPVRGTDKQRERERERVLSEAELKRFLAAARARQDAAGELLRFLVMSACRKGEALAMRWQDVDLDAATWTKPAASTKRGTVHRVPLSSEAVDLLRRLGQGADAAPIGAAAQPEAGACVFTLGASSLQRAFVAVCAAAEVTGARIHDLRRTSATALCAAAVPLPVVGRLLGHAAGSAITSRIYARSTSAGEVEAVARLGRIAL